MVAFSRNRSVACLLVLWIALAPVMFAVTAAAMALQMGAASAAAVDCDACPDAEAAHEGGGVCALMCWNATLAATAVDIAASPAPSPADRHPELQSAPHGRFATPEPAPPKASLL